MPLLLFKADPAPAGVGFFVCAVTFYFALVPHLRDSRCLRPPRRTPAPTFYQLPATRYPLRSARLSSFTPLSP